MTLSRSTVIVPLVPRYRRRHCCASAVPWGGGPHNVLVRSSANAGWQPSIRVKRVAPHTYMPGRGLRVCNAPSSAQTTLKLVKTYTVICRPQQKVSLSHMQRTCAQIPGQHCFVHCQGLLCCCKGPTRPAHQAAPSGQRPWMNRIARAKNKWSTAWAPEGSLVGHPASRIAAQHESWLTPVQYGAMPCVGRGPLGPGRACRRTAHSHTARTCVCSMHVQARSFGCSARGRLPNHDAHPPCTCACWEPCPARRRPQCGSPWYALSWCFRHSFIGHGLLFMPMKLPWSSRRCLPQVPPPPTGLPALPNVDNSSA